MFNIGDKVIYIDSGKKYSWRLNNYEEYEISNISSVTNTLYYGVKNKRGVETTWYNGDDFITIKQHRKLKLEKLNENRFVF